MIRSSVPVLYVISVVFCCQLRIATSSDANVPTTTATHDFPSWPQLHHSQSSQYVHLHTECGATHTVHGASICCNNKVIPIKHGADMCCKDVAYNLMDSFCCSDKIHSKSLGMQCCGTVGGDQRLYNLTTELCCAGQVKARGQNTHCCGSTLYEEKKQICCTGVLHPRGMYADCCGARPYSPQLPHNDCCMGHEVYNPTFQMCCKHTSRAMLRSSASSCKPLPI